MINAFNLLFILILLLGKCVIEGDGIFSGPQTAEGKGRFSIKVVSTTGEVIKEGVEKLKVTITGPSGELPSTIKDKKNGTFDVEYDRLQPGSYQVHVTIEGVPVAESPYDLDVILVVSSENSSCSGQALEDGVFAKQKSDFSVSTRDVCQNPCVSGGAIVDVMIELDDNPSSPKSPRSPPVRGKEDEKPVSSVKDEENGSYFVEVTYPAAGKYKVSVLVNGQGVKGSPFIIRVDKPPSAGSKWQAKYEDDAELRRREREKERVAEIERAKKNFLEQAEVAKRAAAEKERKQLEEEERQRQIAEHMERMRTEEGDEVRATVLEKVKAQATDDIYEPEEGDMNKAGKKWAAQFNEEDKKRKEQREAERQAEIAAAKANYIDHASEAVFVALTKEEKQLKEEARLRDIEEHQREVRLR